MTGKDSELTEKKIVFIVLHYMAVEVTLECVRHIRKNMDTDSYQIVIVDNHSPDESYRILNEKYGCVPCITLLHNEENLGFSRGNNVGIRYALRHYRFDFMVVLNNDAFLLETAFAYKLDRYFSRYHFAVAGPRVIDKLGRNSNPVSDHLPSEKVIRERIQEAKTMLWMNRVHLFSLYTNYLEWKSKLIRVAKILRNREKFPPVVNQVRKNVVLHGSFWIFSGEYFRIYDGLNEKKSMFVEEQTLLYKLLQKNLLSVYLPDILVLHLEDASTDAVYRKPKEKMLFVYEKTLEAWKEYRDMVSKEPAE